MSELGNHQITVSRFHIPYDPELFAELNTLTYNLTKIGKIQYTHQQGTHDDRFWAICLHLVDKNNSNKPIWH